jgi:hypothetical protein
MSTNPNTSESPPPSSHSEGDGVDNLEDISPIDAQDENAGDDTAAAAELTSNFEDLPLVQEVRELMAARGYGEKDPTRIYLDVAAAFDRRCQLLTTRQVHVFSAMNDHIGELKDELANLSVAMDELTESNEQTVANHTALMDTFEKVLAVCGQFTPFLEKAAREIVVASDVIENRSVKALLFSYLSPAFALCAGFILSLIFR